MIYMSAGLEQKFFITKKGKEDCGCFIVLFYGFFLSKSKPTMAIAMIIAITAAAIPIVRADIVARPLQVQRLALVLLVAS